ncbi:hypothetical protein HCA58_02150 [Micromonospora sp. HNM0581]|uniref:hypothetical protein n=1 Tax=Micromonospora sp. HNM0581 TaxID=2716341 RepID=UPI00146BADCA|nr:hypothetical protein [Micromonospora sp. HNM0581]NLU77212.1 hypothetical protein [Micromonospora sp. HNM0581]
MSRGSVAPPRPGSAAGTTQLGELPGVPAYAGGSAWRRDSLSADGIGWIGAHGGAGASTLTRLLGGTDIGCRWPDPALAEPAQVMVTGRTNLDGLRAVSRVLNAMREGRHPADLRLVGVVLIADLPGWLPPPLLARIRLLRSISPVYRLPWIPQLRVGAEPKQLPRQLSRLSAVVDRHVRSRRQP